MTEEQLVTVGRQVARRTRYYHRLLRFTERMSLAMEGAWRAWPKYDPARGRLVPYLAFKGEQHVRHAVRDMLRRVCPPHHCGIDPETPDPRPAEESEEDALRRLARFAPHHMVVLLRDVAFLGMEQQYVARKFGISESAISQRLRRFGELFGGPDGMRRALGA